MPQLPQDIIACVLQHVSPRDRLTSCCLVSKAWHATCCASLSSMTLTCDRQHEANTAFSWLSKHGKGVTSVRVTVSEAAERLCLDCDLQVWSWLKDLRLTGQHSVSVTCATPGGSAPPDLLYWPKHSHLHLTSTGGHAEPRAFSNHLLPVARHPQTRRLQPAPGPLPRRLPRPQPRHCSPHGTQRHRAMQQQQQAGRADFTHTAGSGRLCSARRPGSTGPAHRPAASDCQRHDPRPGRCAKEDGPRVREPRQQHNAGPAGTPVGCCPRWRSVRGHLSTAVQNHMSCLGCWGLSVSLWQVHLRHCSSKACSASSSRHSRGRKRAHHHPDPCLRLLQVSPACPSRPSNSLPTYTSVSTSATAPAPTCPA